MQPLDFGLQRLSNVADTRLGRELDPEKVLGARRHGEWSTGFGGKGARARGLGCPWWGSPGSISPSITAQRGIGEYNSLWGARC